MVEQPPIGWFAEIDGRQLWMHQSGRGAPAVVFVPGAGSVGMDFLLVHQRVADVTTAVSYDRAGTGWSDDNPLPRTADEVTDELRALLRQTGVPGPYVLVGHSLGGAYVQRYAQRFPAEVSALLLLDPAHEDWDRYMPAALKLANQPASAEFPELPAGFLEQYRVPFSAMFANFPDAVREQLIDRHLSPAGLPIGFREGANALAVFDELRAGGPRPDVPLIVLSSTGVDAAQTMLVPEVLLREQIAGSERLYDDLADRAPRGEHRSLPDASHAS
ncbi:MAG: alpha/beta hydrolase, partial [Nakamurella sp.]